jgi:hypothetical protein
MRGGRLRARCARAAQPEGDAAEDADALERSDFEEAPRPRREGLVGVLGVVQQLLGLGFRV